MFHSVLGPAYQGCSAIIIGGCAGTRHGCCPDGVSAAAGENQAGCLEVVTSGPLILGGCGGTQHGCCPDGSTAAAGPNGLGELIEFGLSSLSLPHRA